MFLYWFSEDVPHPGRILRGSWEMQITGSEKVLRSLDSKSLNSRAGRPAQGSGAISEEPGLKLVISWAALCFPVIPQMQQEPVQTCTVGFFLAGQGRT